MSKRLLFLIFINFIYINAVQHRALKSRKQLSVALNRSIEHRKQPPITLTRSIKSRQRLSYKFSNPLHKNNSRKHSSSRKAALSETIEPNIPEHLFLPTDLVIPIIVSAQYLKEAGHIIRSFLITDKKNHALLNDSKNLSYIIKTLSEKFKTSGEGITKIISTDTSTKIRRNQLEFKEKVCTKNIERNTIEKALSANGINLDFTFSTKKNPQNILTLLVGINRKKALDIVKLLIKKGAKTEEANFLEMNIYTQLHYLPELLAMNAFDVNQTYNRNGDTILTSLLHYAMAVSHSAKHTENIYDKVKLLLEKGADPEQPNKQEESPLYCADKLADKRFITLIEDAIDNKKSLPQA